MGTDTLHTWFSFPRHFSDEWCDNIINRGLVEELCVATVSDKTTGKPYVPHPDERKSETVFLDSERFSDVYNDIKKVQREANLEFFGFDIADVQPIQFTKYCGNYKSHYDWHADQLFRQDPPYSRKMSVVIPLSDPNTFEGGDFEFRDTGSPDRQIHMQRGSVLCFPSYYSHRVTPVTKGTRYSLVCWFLGPPFR